jgi:hypothetical protein
VGNLAPVLDATVVNSLIGLIIANASLCVDPVPVNVALVPKATNPPNCANLIIPVSNTSILGIPEMSLTENIVPDIELVILNNCPADPSKLSVPLLVG